MCIKYNVENPDLAVGDAMHTHIKVKCHSGPICTIVSQK